MLSRAFTALLFFMAPFVGKGQIKSGMMSKRCDGYDLQVKGQEILNLP